MNTVAVKISVPDAYQEILIAELADLDFESFEQHDRHLLAYIPSSRWNDVARETIGLWLAAHELPTRFEEEVIADQNWNREWEESIRAVAIPPFLVKPTWREVPPEHRDLILLEIDPKMSFGTGYHESTRLMLRMLPDVIEPGDDVLDAGTGTGILAIAAVKLGAATAVAFDIDPWSQENAVENIYINNVQKQIDVRAGSIELVGERDFDVIIANINLNVVAGLLPVLVEKMVAGGALLISGILIRDRDRLLQTAERRGLALAREMSENEWWAGCFRTQFEGTME